MSVIRKLAVSAAGLLLGLGVLFVTTGTAAAECDWNVPVPCRMAN